MLTKPNASAFLDKGFFSTLLIVLEIWDLKKIFFFIDVKLNGHRPSANLR